MRCITSMRWASLALTACMLGCSAPLPVTGFSATGPAFDPIRFFTGHVRSWGVLEDRSGQPTSIVATDCTGEVDGAGTLRMTQRLTIGQDPPTTREWRMHRTGPNTVEATANDMVGPAAGESSGRAFHWRWTLALQPGNPLKNVTMEQWWYLMNDGSMLNRTIVSKLGFIAAEVSEHFVPDK